MNCDKNVKQLDYIGRQRRVIEWRGRARPLSHPDKGSGLPSIPPRTPGFSRRLVSPWLQGAVRPHRSAAGGPGPWGQPAATWGTRPREAGVAGPSRSLLILVGPSHREMLHAKAAWGPTVWLEGGASSWGHSRGRVCPWAQQREPAAAVPARSTLPRDHAATFVISF